MSGIAIWLDIDNWWHIRGDNIDVHDAVWADDKNLKEAAARFLVANLHVIRIYLLRTRGPVCSKCGSKGSVELDHIKPRSHGRDDRVSNLQLLGVHCGCHAKKTGNVQWSKPSAASPR